MTINDYIPWLLPPILGVISHIFYFKNGEHHLYSFIYLQFSTLIPCFAVLMLCIATNNNKLDIARLVLLVEFLYFISLWTSILIYRSTSFHRLYSYPGPFSWRITKLAQAWHNRHLRGMDVLDKLHQSYGDYVRTGPTELSIIDPDSLLKIHNSLSKCVRAPWYDMAVPLKSVFETRNKTEHDKRRRVWDRAFTKNCLLIYEFKIETHINQLLRNIESLDGQLVNVSKWFTYFSLDVIGDLAFSKGFGMLDGQDEGKRAGARIIDECQKGLPVMGPVPWTFTILTRTPFVSRPFYKMVEWCLGHATERMTENSAETDFMSFFLDDKSRKTNTLAANAWLAGDSRIIIAAGSAAVASTLTFSMYHLAKDEALLTAIREELSKIKKTGNIEATRLQTLAPYLNAFISEVLRLYPPNPSGFLRQTPAEGLHIGERYIPGHVTICTPLWSLHRSSKCFAKPLEFIPDRWLNRPELVLRKDAYIPFGHGPYNCVGKQLALMEIRLTLAEIVMFFDFTFAEGEEGENLLKRSLDTFTLTPGDLKLMFKKRDHALRVD